MARDGSVTLPFGDGLQLFRLRLGQLFELQDKINRPRLQLMAAAGVENPQPIGPGMMVQMLGTRRSCGRTKSASCCEWR